MTRRSAQPRAILLAIAAFTFFVLCDSAMKFAGRSSLPNYEIVAILGGFTSALIAAYCLVTGKRQNLRARHPAKLFIRGLFDAGNNLFVVVALRHLPLTLFYICVFMSPILICLLGRIFLREQIPAGKWLAILVGFAGVVVAVNPFRAIGRGDWIGFGACALCVSFFSSGVVWSKDLMETEHAESMTFLSGLATVSAGSCAMLIHASPIDARLAIVLTVMGVLGVLGSICFFTAVKYAPVSTVSFFHYSQLLSGAAVAYLVFHETPTIAMIAGAALIAASGIYIARFPATE